jgi:hypothetical protein
MVRAHAVEYEHLSPMRAAHKALFAESDLQRLDLPDGLVDGLIQNLRFNLALRAQRGFSTNPTNNEEVGGAVRAVMAENDHMKDLETGLRKWTVASLQARQADVDRIRSAREQTTYGAEALNG